MYVHVCLFLSHKYVFICWFARIMHTSHHITSHHITSHHMFSIKCRYNVYNILARMCMHLSIYIYIYTYIYICVCVCLCLCACVSLSLSLSTFTPGKKKNMSQGLGATISKTAAALEVAPTRRLKSSSRWWPTTSVRGWINISFPFETHGT